MLQDRFVEYILDNPVMIYGSEENFPIHCAFHGNTGSSLFVTIPGVDGSYNGYKDKYIQMANKLTEKSDISVLRTSNPYISGLHWDINYFTIIEHIEQQYSNFNDYIFFGFSAGGSIIAKHAHTFDRIKHIILVNTAKQLFTTDIISGLEQFQGKISIVYGENDPNIKLLDLFNPYLLNKTNITKLSGCDHFFTGHFLNEFINLPTKILIEEM